MANQKLTEDNHDRNSRVKLLRRQKRSRVPTASRKRPIKVQSPCKPGKYINVGKVAAP